jgi:hypothetical protein
MFSMLFPELKAIDFSSEGGFSENLALLKCDYYSVESYFFIYLRLT